MAAGGQSFADATCSRFSPAFKRHHSRPLCHAALARPVSGVSARFKRAAGIAVLSPVRRSACAAFRDQLPGTPRPVSFFSLLVWPDAAFFTEKTLHTTLRVALLIFTLILAVVLALCAWDALLQIVLKV